MNGLLLIDKPEGLTSFKVCSIVKKKLNIKRVGHVGTLDPLATGVLPILIGQAARFSDFLNAQTKSYTAQFKLGIRTDTLDIEGKILEENSVDVTFEQVKKEVESFLGEINQIPPMYSAIKSSGQPLYKLARQGIEIERKARTVQIHSIELESFNETTGIINVVCSKGTYIRTLIDDLGNNLGCGGIMTNLRRTSSSGFNVNECISLEDFEVQGEKAVKSADNAILHFPKIDVSSKQAVRFLNGGTLDLLRLKISETSQYYRVYSEDFLGIGELVEDGVKPKCVLSK